MSNHRFTFSALVSVLAALALVLTAVPGTVRAEGALPERDVLVLFTSDVHCGADQGFTYAGLWAVRQAAEAAGNAVLLVDNGDSVQGEPIGLLSSGMASLELMNAMGYDAAIPGNHEFDYGMDRFLELAEAADFPYVSCNFRRAGELVFPPYVILEAAGVKIAFVGVTTPETITTSTPRFFQDESGAYLYDFTGETLYDAVQEAADSARAESADYVILLAHLGNVAGSGSFTYADVAEHTAGIDAILDGHSHDTDKALVKNKDGQNVVRQACGTKMEGIGWLRISAAGGVDTGLYSWSNSEPAPQLLGFRNEMSDRLDAAYGGVNDLLSTVVGNAAVDVTISDPEALDEAGHPIRLIRRAETNLGDLCTDAVRAAAGADIAVVNGGSIRVTISRGAITTNDILCVFPYGNTLLKLEMTGQSILDALEWGARACPMESGAFLHVSGLTYEIHTGIENSCAVDEHGMFAGVTGEYRVQNVMVGDEPLDLNRVYTVAGQSYTLLDNGDGFTSFDGAKVLWESDELDYELFIRYIQEELGGTIGAGYEDPYGQGRIVAVP
ncbi:MAG: bifunctional metallophosphatase/5'-nucleotidase [Clostridia bacterium]|nr:bifunctional metallophosphatase/5'-nucleotidase [Clostridia bacterium]